MLVLKLEEIQEFPTLCCRFIMGMSLLSEVSPNASQMTGFITFVNLFSMGKHCDIQLIIPGRAEGLP